MITDVDWQQAVSGDGESVVDFWGFAAKLLVVKIGGTIGLV